MSDMVFDTKDLERMAMRGCDPPKGLTLAGEWFYLSMVNLYRLYQRGIYSKEQAHDIKLDLLSKYEKAMFNEKLLHYHARIQNGYSEVLTEAEKHGCPVCKKLVRVFDGREFG